MLAKGDPMSGLSSREIKGKGRISSNQREVEKVLHQDLRLAVRDLLLRLSPQNRALTNINVRT